MKNGLLACGSCVLLLVTAACESHSPARPTDAESAASTAIVSDAVTGITVTTPTRISPTVNQQFRFAEQPLALKLTNAVHTGTSPTTYTFEVASDSAFAALVFSKEGVAEGGKAEEVA